MKAEPFEPELVWEYFDRRNSGFFIEVGANDPRQWSQTWFLESKGWTGILVEPLPHLARRLEAERSRSRVVQAACGPRDHPAIVPLYEAAASGHSGLRKNAIDGGDQYVAVHQVPMLSLDEILAREGNPKVDFISIDVEGLELEVLRGLDLERHAPGLLLIEDHLFHWRTHRHTQRSGYKLVKRTGLNNWYIPKGHPFPGRGLVERAKLWRKVWPGTPARAFKHRLEMWRAGVSHE